jgi:N-acetylmuramoyl-L-alanine amidase
LTREDPFLLLIKTLGFTLCLALLPAGAPADAGRFLVFYKQARKAIPKLSIGSQTYLPVIDLLHLLELPYSESVSVGFVQITKGKNRLRLAKDDSQVVLNDRKIALSAPVTVVKNQWVVPLDFVSKALDRTLDEKIAMSASGNAAAVGESDFIRLTVRVVETNHTLRLQASRPVAAEVQQQGLRLVFAFGNTPVDFAGSEGVQRTEWIRSVALDQSESVNQLVIELAENVRNAKISHLASQNAYMVEVVRQEGGEPKTDAPAELPRSAIAAWKWRHITVDAGHGGPDRGVAIRENVFEKDVALAIARKLRWALETRLGVPVVLSRAEDQAQRLEDRIAAANLARSNLFISIHTGNAYGSPAHSYAYTARWITDEGSAGETRNARSLFVPWWEAQRNSLAWSERLAECVQAEMNRALNGGQPLIFRRTPLKLLSALAMPAVLVEIGNARVPDFQAKVESEPFQNLVAATLAAAVEKFRPLHERP